ncbi:hypothetical protein CCL08_15215 [Pseudomonas congelans]|nr:hypothetical protein CCL08_15215 [Pseudomonas congelans]
MVLVQTRFGGFFIACDFPASTRIASEFFLTPDYPLLARPFEKTAVRYSERLTRRGGTWLFAARLALRNIGSIKG